MPNSRTFATSPRKSSSQDATMAWAAIAALEVATFRLLVTFSRLMRAGAPAHLAPQLVLLAESAQTTAAILGTADVAAQARTAASTLLDASLGVEST